MALRIDYVSRNMNSTMKRGDLTPDYRKLNPWWETGDVTVADRYESKRRSDYDYKLRRVRNNRLVNIAGAAGSGKTTTLHQIADDLTSEDGIPPRKIMYLPVGDPRFQIGNDVIRDAVDEFATYYWQRDTEPGTGYVFIDDAHALDSWSDQVRDCLDEYPDLTIAVTLPTIARASTDGIEELEFETDSDLLLPPKFYDFVSEHHDIEVAKDTVRNVRDTLEHAADTGDASALQSGLDDLLGAIDATSTLKRGVVKYFQGEGRNSNASAANHNLELTVYRDIPRYQQFDDRSDLHALCAVAAMYPGHTLGLKNLSELLECDRRTLQRYIDILEDFFILTPSYQYKHERKRSVRLYLRDPILLAALLDLDFDGLLPTQIEDNLISTVIFDHLKRLGFRYQGTNSPVGFWESGDVDVDFVLETGEGIPIPIVTPNTNDPRTPTDRVDSFRDEYDCTYGVHVARDAETSVENELITLPLWLFLFFI